MKFARVVFLIAGLWGLAILTPLYFTFDLVGRSYPPAITHPDFYYGFVSVAWVWQIAFLTIGGNPVRHRPFMLVAILEKLIYVTAMVSLYVNGYLHVSQVVVAVPDFTLATALRRRFCHDAGGRLDLVLVPAGRFENACICSVGLMARMSLTGQSGVPV